MAGDFDLDLLASHLRNHMDSEGLSLRKSAEQVGCGAATLSRLLQGSESQTVPSGENLIRAASWLGRSLSEFESGARPDRSNLADVEVHLRALPNLSKRDAQALVGIVKAAYDSFRRSKKT